MEEKTVVRDYKNWLLGGATLDPENEHDEHEREIFFRFVLDLAAGDDSVTQVDYDKIVLYIADLKEEFPCNQF